MHPDWLHIVRGQAPLIVSVPHAGTDLAALEPKDSPRLVSPWLARKDADWWVDRLYAFAADMGATLIATRISRTVIDVNRDPSGASLYPGQITTGLCPTETFDGEPLYRPGDAPDTDEIAARRARYFEPYHTALAAELARLRASHADVVLYDAHSIRSTAPRLFDGQLPNFNIGTNSHAACAPALADAVARVCAASSYSHVVDDRFKGGWITRHYGRPGEGVHAVQMELAARTYMREPETFTETAWPTPFDEAGAADCRAILRAVLAACLDFASKAR
ncbi:MAG: N-formylglutamate deformylase [Hyphomonadaceae bacterium]|nr:N-formylglutamate deformylase [Hyphomonadaceae bacterium]